MIYDCFSFFNEFDILDIRLHELNDIVDRFVLVEAPRTYRGEKKPLYFAENKERYSEFLEKIIHVVVDDLPTPINGDRWPPQIFQRRQLIRGLSSCSMDDIVIFSDLDEIPEASVIKEVIAGVGNLGIIKKGALLIFAMLSSFEKQLTGDVRGTACRLVGRLKWLFYPKEAVIKVRHKHFEYYVNGFVHDEWPGFHHHVISRI